MILGLSIHGGLSAGKRAHGAITEDRGVLLEELLSGKKQGRTSEKQITYSERGNI